MSDEKIRWKKLGSKAGPELPLFKARIDTLVHPKTSVEFDRLVLEAPDWVTVVAVDGNGDTVIVEQHRFGVGDLTLEPIGGIVDEGETPLEAGKRELLEETGYGGGRWHYLGSVQANPAYQPNLCHHWLAQGVQKLQSPMLDEGEAIRVHLMSLDELKAAIASGRLKHALGLSALSRVFPLWELPHILSTE